MAGNKFATMLHRNTNNIIVILVYAVLEWILIILLLFNSLFTYLITKFAQYFGLKQPCTWCSRVDHILEPGNITQSYRDRVCDTHATEISKLSYCSNHRKLAESHRMCMDCLASRPNHNENNMGITQTIAFFSWVSRDKLDNGEEETFCSCCNESLNSSRLYPPYSLFKPSWGVLDYAQKGGLVVDVINDENSESDQCKDMDKSDSLLNSGEEEDDDDDVRNQTNVEEAENEHQILSDDGDCSRSLSNLQSEEKEATSEDEKEDVVNTEDSVSTKFVHQFADDDIIIECCGDDDSLEIIERYPEKYITYCPDRLIPIEMIDASTTANFKDEDLGKQHYINETSDSALQIETHAHVLGEAALHVKDECAKEIDYEELEASDKKMEGTEISVHNAEDSNQDLVCEPCEKVVSSQAAQTIPINEDNNIEAPAMDRQNNDPAHEEEINGFKVSVDGSELKNLASSEVPEARELVLSLAYPLNDQSSVVDNDAQISDSLKPCITENDFGLKQRGTTVEREQLILSDKNQQGTNHHLGMRSEPYEAEEEKFPDTPTSMESLHYLHKKLLLSEKRESGTEDSLDGSVVNEMEAGDPVLTVERLKTALKAERKALSALYTELEEERSASAVSTSQTMAMINRLQEEKAAMQMEALQYQRMMEEQAEYDQEALQLMNELMIKREKEKQELEKELDIYRKKVLDYETKEKMRKMRRIKDRSGNSCASYSNEEDSEELSIDLNREARDEDSSSYGNIESINNITPAEAVLNLEEVALDCVKHIGNLDDSLAEFEEERMSILEQIKALEEKILTLGDSEFVDSLNSLEHSSEYNVREFNESHEFSSPQQNGISEDKHFTMSSMAKNLLPLLDAADYETQENFSNEEKFKSESVEMQQSLDSKFKELDSKKIELEEEVDHVYERLQALEADREFLKHCMSSIKQGDKGMDLLREILQHLRDLRAVELRLKNISDDTLQ